MEKLIFDTERDYGKFKFLNAVNNGPAHRRGNDDQLLTDFVDYKAAKIPYARNHDAAFCETYGGEHTVDIAAVFPDFSADPYDPDSYDFVLTDEYIETTLDAGTETFYRLGNKIEHNIKKYNTLPPADFNKWAVVCEHIIRHCNYGWAGGKSYGITYWEIWNEPDLDPDDSTNKRTWGGTKAQYFDLYEITSKHLKKCFPTLKIGGPALACDDDWGHDFIVEMAKRNAVIDFFSWHIYTENPEKMIAKAEKYRKFLDENGFTKAESICNEWNYIRGWTTEFAYSIKSIISAKGASFILACMASALPSSIDMLMYYDARPGAFNALFDCYFLDKLPGYYPIYWYGKLYEGFKEIRAKNGIKDIYTICGKNGAGKRMLYCTHYNSNDETPAKDVEFDLGENGTYNVYLVNNEHENELIATTSELKFKINNFDCLYIEEV